MQAHGFLIFIFLLGVSDASCSFGFSFVWIIVIKVNMHVSITDKNIQAVHFLIITLIDIEFQSN